MSGGRRYEERPRFRCDHGTILVCERPMDRPKRKPCPSCKGTGRERVFLYPPLRKRA